MRTVPCAFACLLVAACFAPAPREGFACGLDDWCPAPLFCAADHTCRSADSQGDGGVDGAPGPSNYAFVTSKTFLPSSLMNIAGADDQCMKAAEVGRLPGRYVAWLSVSGQRPRERLGTASGWRRTDSKPFLRDLSALSESNVLYPLRKTETGADLAGTVLTGTDESGNPGGEDCHGLSSASQSDLILVGESTGGTTLWTKTSDIGCNEPGHLYCLQIDHQQPVMPAREPGPVAFLSSPYMPIGGLAGADDWCMGDAAAIGLAGTFKALLSTTTMAALDRFLPLPSLPWVRVDGVATTRDFVTWDAPINVTVSGGYVDLQVLSGAASPTAKSLSGGESCDDWNGGNAAVLGRAASASTAAFGASSGGCLGNSLYCLQVP
jgi:hypothetical protein